MLKARKHLLLCQAGLGQCSDFCGNYMRWIVGLLWDLTFRTQGDVMITIYLYIWVSATPTESARFMLLFANNQFSLLSNWNRQMLVLANRTDYSPLLLQCSK